MYRYLFFLCCLLGLTLDCLASQTLQYQSTDTTMTIINAIEQDSIITIVQPEGMIGKLGTPGAPIMKEEKEEQSETVEENAEDMSDPLSGATVKSAGYRVQVFSDNNVKTAKNEARSMANAISAKYPQYKTYVVFQSPYWRLKVGDFPTQAEAQTALEMIKRAFPNYSRELRIVKDRINRRVK